MKLCVNNTRVKLSGCRKGAMTVRLFGFGRARAKRGASAVPQRVGLVLGGGALRGAAHLGVLSVLEDAGVRPAVVAGTSVGAIIGAGVAAGVPAAEMWDAFRVLDWRHVARPSWGSRLSMLASDPLGALIARVTRVGTFEELGMPFAAVACDLLTGSRVVVRSGDLPNALAGSSAIPALFEPVRCEGAVLVDGGVVDNLPVDVARDLGADYVIAIDIMPALDGGYEPKHVRDVVLMAWNIVEHNTEGGRDLADIVITPDVANIRLSDFRQVPEAFDAGVAAGRAALPQIRRDLGLAQL